MPKQIVLMSGLPAAGKSTLARALAARLEFALVSKDAVLSTLHGALGSPANQLDRIGPAAWAVFWVQARQCPRVVLDSNIRPGSVEQRAQLLALDGRIVEVACRCPPAVAQERYAHRAAAGPPGQRFTELTAERIAEYAGPIGLGALVDVDTSGPVDVDALVRDIVAVL
jgi:predicted kinase